MAADALPGYWVLGGAEAKQSMGAFINPFISQHIPLLWSRLIPTFGRDVDYWPGGDQTQAVTITLIWSEGTLAEEISPGRYSHALIKDGDLPAAPAQGDALNKDGIIFWVVRVSALPFYFSEVVLQERDVALEPINQWRR